MNIEITDEQMQFLLEQHIKTRVDNFFKKQKHDYIKELVTCCVTKEVRARINAVEEKNLIKEVNSKALIESISNKVTESIVEALAQQQDY